VVDPIRDRRPLYSATWFLALHIYNQAFKYFQMGYGSALAWLFLAILMVFTIIQTRFSNSWVYYGGESK
jgi:ABC-type sugar transport system permease subunit